MRTIHWRFLFLAPCLLLPACYGQYVVAHEIIPPGDCRLDPHRPIRVSDGDQLSFQIRLECIEPAGEVAPANRADASRLLIALLDADRSELERALAAQRSGVQDDLATILGQSGAQIFRGAGRKPNEEGRFWTESVVLETIPWDSLIRESGGSESRLILAVAGSGVPVPTATERMSLQARLHSVLQGEGSGSYLLEPQEAEQIGLTSSSLLGIGFVGIVSLWLGNR